MEYRERRWVTIIKLIGDMSDEFRKYYSQFINQTFEVKEKGDFNGASLDIPHYMDKNIKNTNSQTFWKGEEIRPATLKEIKQAQERLCAEAL